MPGIDGGLPEALGGWLPDGAAGLAGADMLGGGVASG